jgi:hypothetical protein
MKIITFTFGDNVLGLSLDCAPDEAVSVLRYIEQYGSQPARALPPPASVTTEVTAPVLAASVASSQPRIDPEAIARLAASNPVPPPKPEKPKASRKKADESEAVQEAAPAPAAPTQEAASVDPTPATTEVDPVPSSRAPVMVETQIEKPEATTSALPPEVVNATRMRDVVVYFLKQGCKTLPEVVEKMRAVQPMVPVLSGVADLEGRAKRTWEVIDMEDL